MYELPKFGLKDFISWSRKILKNKSFKRASYVIVFALAIFGLSGYFSFKYFPNETKLFFDQFKFSEIFEIKQREIQQEKDDKKVEYVSEISYEQAIINTVKTATQSVVSIVVSKNLPTYVQEWVNPFGDSSFFDIQIPQYVQKGTEYKKVGSGSGFIISNDGLILTNKHVVSDNEADYTVIMNDGSTYKTKILALDPVQDLAIIKIEDAKNKTFVPLVLGDSSGIQIGQSVVAIGNALGEFNNTVSVGIVSGLSRTISASDQIGSIYETLDDIIQTDAAINSGNSGGPLMNLKGEVIGINTAMAQNASNIAFAIPINYAKKDIEQVISTNKISYPFLGVRYLLVDASVQKEYELFVDYGALVLKGIDGEPAVTEDSPAQKSGIKEKDVILEFNGEKITKTNTLSKIIQKYNVGDSIKLKILRDDSEQEIDVVLSERL